MHLGASTCTGPVCHSSAEEQKNTYGDEWFLWHEDDRHSQAYAVLRNAASKRIVRNLGYQENAWELGICAGRMLVKTWSSTLMRAAARLVEDAGYTAEDAGFRCARETEVWPEATD